MTLLIRKSDENCIEGAQVNERLIEFKKKRCHDTQVWTKGGKVTIGKFSREKKKKRRKKLLGEREGMIEILWTA